MGFYKFIKPFLPFFFLKAMYDLLGNNNIVENHSARDGGRLIRTNKVLRHDFGDYFVGGGAEGFINNGGNRT